MTDKTVTGKSGMFFYGRPIVQFYENTKFDVIVIGSGPGGATVANELSKRGKRVLILTQNEDRQSLHM